MPPWRNTQRLSIVLPSLWCCIQGRRHRVCRECGCTPTFWILHLVKAKYLKNLQLHINLHTHILVAYAAPANNKIFLLEDLIISDLISKITHIVKGCVIWSNCVSTLETITKKKRERDQHLTVFPESKQTSRLFC